MKLVVKNKTLKIENGETLISGNVNTYDLEVNYDKTYNDCSFLYVTFVNEDIKKKQLVGPDKVVKIPSEVLESKGNLVVGFFGIYLEDNILKERHVTNTDVLPIVPGGYDENAEETEVLTPTILEKYLAEMKEFYIKSLDEYNTNSNDKLKEYNENTLLKLTEYDNNAKSKTNDFNSNYEAKKNEVDKTAGEVVQNKTDIEEIEKRVSASEQNAKASETNAKTSEQSAQNSLNKVTEIETNITGIQEEINQTKEEIDTTKTSIDNSVEEVNRAVTEATNQASESKKQADIAITNANQTSTDKQAAETMKNDISVMKTSVEQTKSATEQIKADTQSIYNNTVDAKNETLEAKTEVENSLENERIESDKKYARAIESEEIVVEEYGQVELDEDGYMKGFSAEGNLSDIAQDTRDGYNEVKGFISEGIYNGTLENAVFKSVSLNGYGNARLRFEPIILKANNTYFSSIDCKSLNNSYIGSINILLYYLSGENEYGTKRGNIIQSPNINNEYQRTIAQFDIEEDIEVSGFLIQTNNATDAIIELTNPMISEQNLDYEPYGVSPSIYYPSYFENVVENVEINNTQENLIDITATSQIHGGVDFKIEEGIVIANGLCNSSGNFILGTRFLVKDESYFFSGCPKGMYSGSIALTILNSKNEVLARDYGDGVIFKPIETGIYKIAIYHWYNYKSENIVFKPMLNYGTVPLEWSLYNGYVENLSLSEGQFLGNFNGFKNYIKDDKLKCHLEILTLDGTSINRFISKHSSIVSDTRGFYQFRLPNKKRSFSGDDKNALCSHVILTSLIAATDAFKTNKDLMWWEGSSEYCYISLPFITLEEANNWLKEQYEAGTPVQILYVTNEEFKEDLSVENKSKINFLKVYKGINNVNSNCKISFKANRAIDKIIEENNTKEREISDSKYARALPGKVVDEKSVQIYAENSEVENLTLKGNKITQKNRQGYNKYNKDTEVVGMISSLTGVLTSSNISWHSSDYIPVKELVEYLFSWKSSSSYFQVVFAYYNSNKEFINGNSIAKSNIYKTNITIPENASFLRISYSVVVSETSVNRYEIQLVEGLEEKAYEEYGASPSLDYPSEIEVTTEQTIDNNQGNIVKPAKLKVFNSNKYVSNKPAYNEAPAYCVEPNTEYAIISNIEFGDAGFIGWKDNVNNGRLAITKDTKYNKLVRYFNTGDNNQLSFYVGGFLTDVQGVYQTFTSIDDFFKKTEFMIIKSSFIKNGALPEFRPYNGYTKKIILPEGKFNNSLGNNQNYIAKINNKWNLVNTIKKLTIEDIKSLTLGYQDKEDFALLVTTLDNSIRDYFFALCPILCNVLPNLKDVSYETSKEMICIYRHDAVNQLRINISKSRLDSFEGVTYVDKFKAMLDDMIEKELDFDIYYPLVEASYEYAELPEETQQVLNSIELMDDLNIISVDNGFMSFEYNKSFVKVLEEKDNKISELEKQVALNGNYELIDEMVSTTEQQAFEFNNLKLEKAIIYMTAEPNDSVRPGELIVSINNLSSFGTKIGIELNKYSFYKITIDKLTNNLYKVNFLVRTNIDSSSSYKDVVNAVIEHTDFWTAEEINKISLRHFQGATGAGTKVTLYGVKISDSEENEVQALNEVTEENVIEENTIINENIENNEIENV